VPEREREGGREGEGGEGGREGRGGREGSFMGELLKEPENQGVWLSRGLGKDHTKPPTETEEGDSETVTSAGWKLKGKMEYLPG
jgi:hypothetical protein